LSHTIGIDIRPLLRNPTGVGLYLGGLLPALAAADHANRYVLFSSSLRDRFDASAVPQFLDGRLVDRRVPVRLLNWAWHFHGYPPLDRLVGEPIHLTHSPHPLILPARRARTVVTIHDLFFLSHPELVEREVSAHYPALVRAHACSADAVVTSSVYSQREIMERLQVDERKIVVIPPGAPAGPRAVRREPGDAILFVGRIEHRKNVENLLRAVAMMREKEVRLRMIGPAGAGHEQARNLAASLGIDDRVAFAGYSSGDALLAEYGRARGLVLPSLCEGFGLPLLEAMHHGVAIAASDVTSIPEVAGDAALYFEPRHPEQIATALDRLWSEPGTRERLVEAGTRRLAAFSWERAARLLLDTYKRLLES